MRKRKQRKAIQSHIVSRT